MNEATQKVTRERDETPKDPRRRNGAEAQNTPAVEIV
jgi:hypothetical protein